MGVWCGWYADTIFILQLENDDPPWNDIWLPHSNCSMTPCARPIRFDLLNDTQNTIVIELLLDFLMLVNWDGCWRIHNYRDCIWLILISVGGPDILGNV